MVNDLKKNTCNEKKLVSVIITTYGREEKLLLEAIKSVQNQSYQNIEIIIIDDNGKGSELQRKNEILLKKYTDIIYIANIVNSGAQISRNKGILRASGEYIACLDDDDIWVKDKIEKQVKLMEKEKLDLVFCNGYRFYNNNINNRKIYQINFISNRIIDFNTELKNDCIGSTSHPLMRKECFAKTGLFDIDMPARQDYEMWLRFCKYYKVKGINEPLFYYRYHDGDRITKSYKKEITSYKLLLKKYREDYKKDSIAKAYILFILSKTYLKNKNIFSFFKYSINAMLINPKVVFKIILNHYNRKSQF